jgi:hypothetical protein
MTAIIFSSLPSTVLAGPQDAIGDSRFSAGVPARCQRHRDQRSAGLFSVVLYFNT